MNRARRLVSSAAAAGLIAGLMAAYAAPAATADSTTIDFEGFTAGSPNGQDGWSRTGSYDHEIVTGYPGAPASFGDTSLRVSNAITSGSFGDQTFSESLGDEAGEASATSNGLSGGTRQSRFVAQWDFVSTSSDEQPGLSVVVSPDRGDGARMGWIQMADSPDGLVVRFFDYRDQHPVGSSTDLASGCDANDDFFQTTIAEGLARDSVHTIAVQMDFLDGPRNDVVQVWVDGVLAHVGTSWEDYFRYCEASDASRTVDSLLFRTSGAAAAATLGKGLLVDNMSLTSGPSQPADSSGSWTLYPAQSVDVQTAEDVTVSYRAAVKAPINADGSSNFPKRRGVIPVQFGLSSSTRTVVTETTTTGPVVFESIGSDNPDVTDNDYSFLRFVPDQPLTFAELDELVADYTFTQGDCVGGSLRWQVRIDVGNDGDETNDGNVMVYFGEPSSFTDCSGAESSSGDNLIGSSDARFDLTQFGGPWFGTYADALDLVGGSDVLRASLVLDSGWAGDQVVSLTGAMVDGAEWEPTPVGTTSSVVSDTSTPFAATCALPAAKLKWSKNDALASGAINEADSIQAKDSGEFFRIVDCKYIYNLDVASLDPNLATRQGTYRVWVNIGGSNVQTPAVFDLK